jgi:hypothetical protein
MASNQYARYFAGGAGSGSSAGVSSLNGLTGNINILPGTGITVSTVGQNITINATNTGTVTSVSVVTANGLSGTVANPTTTPAITLAPTFTGIAYSTGSAFQTAVAGNFPILNQNTTGTAANITATTNSTLTTLTALSLPTSQLSGTISLTTQVSGILPVPNGGTGNSSFTAYMPVLGGTTSTGALQSVSTSGAVVGYVLTYTGASSSPTWQATGSGSGSVTSVSVTTANGFAGTVATPTTTPAISISTTVTGILYGNGTSVAAAVPSNFPILNQNTTGTAANITATSNSTLTTLSALSLPTSQLSGTISLTTQVSGILPVSNGGTGDNSFTAYSPIVGGTTSTGALQSVSNSGATIGQVLTYQGTSSLPTWTTVSGGGSGSAFFQASSKVTTNSSVITSSTFTTFSNSPALTFTPTVSGTYKVYCALPLLTNLSTDWGITRIYNTSGAGTLLDESQGTGYNGGSNIVDTAWCQSVYTLTAGTSYQFDIQGLLYTGPGGVTAAGGSVAFYIFAEQVATGTAANLVIGTIDGNGASSNGLSISASTLYAQSASNSNPGMVNLTSQTFAGSKNFTSPIGYNNATPASNTALDIINTTGATQRIVQTGYGGTVGLRGRYANGTLGSPTAAVSGNILNFFSGLGYGASQFAASATGAFNVVAGETFTNTSNATYLQFSVTNTGSVTSSEAMRVSPAGNLLIATTTDTGQKLQVNGSAIFAGAVTDSVAPIFSSLTGYLYGNASSAVTASTTIPTSALSGTVAIANGGTNASTVAGARTNLGIDSGTQFITSGTTYTTPAGITTATIFKFVLIGGGGGGGGINTASANGSGGGGGGGVVLYAQGLSPSTAYTIAIGGAGTGGTSTTTAATAGGATTITLSSVTYTANGGGAGADTVSTAGGAGGAPSNTFASGFAIGGYNITGKAGRGSTLANADSFSGDGGDSALGYGFGGPAFTTGTAGSGAVGVGYGGGGSGGRGATASGGNGTGGCIVVEYYN